VIVNWYLQAWKKYAVFNGRSRRKEYWMFFLFNFLISVALYGPGLALEDQGAGKMLLALWVGFLLLTMVPALACGVRRLHDTGKSGWLMLIGLVPGVGIVLIVFMAIDGDPDTNKYGPNPKVLESFPAII
jgi:uncharacterized membrane protein YhaH (DUF805 family)